MMGENLEFLALLLGAALAYGIKRLIDRGVMALLAPLLVRCHLSALVRAGAKRSGTSGKGVGTSVDTSGGTWDSNGIVGVGGAPDTERVRTVSGHDRYADVRIGHDQDHADHSDQDGPPPAKQKANADTVRAWCARQLSAGWTYTEVVDDGMRTFDVSERTMKRRISEAQGVDA